MVAKNKFNKNLTNFNLCHTINQPSVFAKKICIFNYQRLSLHINYSV
jgi:hypothetical protein